MNFQHLSLKWHFEKLYKYGAHQVHTGEMEIILVK